MYQKCIQLYKRVHFIHHLYLVSTDLFHFKFGNYPVWSVWDIHWQNWLPKTTIPYLKRKESSGINALLGNYNRSQTLLFLLKEELKIFTEVTELISYFSLNYVSNDSNGGFSRERIVVGHAACSLFGKASEFDVRVRVPL